jgi:hypothetical protein
MARQDSSCRVVERNPLDLRVAVDLIRLRSGGETGGAGGLALSVLRALASQASDSEFILLVRASILDEAVALFGELPNVRLIPVGSGQDAERDGVIASLGADLLFCPFTAPTLALADPSIPVVSTVVDLQHVRYPKFFTSSDRTARTRDLNDACRRADRIICISDFTRSSLLQHASISPERVVAIPIGVPSPPEPVSIEAAEIILNRLGLKPGRF